ncbi:Dimer Tnp hAT domain-containing protein, partial [Aphis craccivora]
MDEVIESNTNISLFIPPLFSSHHQIKVAFVDAQPCQPQSNAPFASNKVYFRKMPDGKYEKHENSKPHDSACKAYFNISSGKTINSFFSHRQKMVELNREIMTRIVDIALLIAKQGLAFRGKRYEAAYNLSDLISNLNQGNFLEIVKLAAKYDPVLQTHINNSIKKSLIKQGKTGRGPTCIWKNFLSKDQTGNDKLRKIKKLGTTWWNSKDAALKNIFGPWSESSETSDRYDILLESLYLIRLSFQYESIVTRIRIKYNRSVPMYCACVVYAVQSNEPRYNNRYTFRQSLDNLLGRL